MKLLMLLCLLAAGQMQAQKVDIESDESTDFLKYRTFRIGEGQLIRMEDALKKLPTPMFGYCRSGARAGSLFSAAKSALG